MSAPVILQFVRPQLVQQPDAAAFLVLVDQQPAAVPAMRLQRDLQLRAAIAAQAVEHVARQTLRVDAHQRRVAALEIAHAQHDGLFGASVQVAAKPKDPEKPELAGKIRFGHLLEPKRRGIVHASTVRNLNPFIIMASETECCEDYLVPLLLKLGVMASHRQHSRPFQHRSKRC